MQKDLKDLIKERYEELREKYSEFPVLYENTVLLIELNHLSSISDPREKVEWWLKRELHPDSPYQKTVNELRDIMDRYTNPIWAEDTLPDVCKRWDMQQATYDAWSRGNKLLYGYDPFDLKDQKSFRKWLESKEIPKDAYIGKGPPYLGEIVPKPRRGVYLTPFIKNAIINSYTEKQKKSIMEKTEAKTKKYFHTFRYQNGNVDRDITIAVVSKDNYTSVGYSVRTPEDRPKRRTSKKAVEMGDRLRKDISTGRAMKTPLEKVFFPNDYAYERVVLRFIALKWERAIKKDGAHAYIKGVPE